MSGYQTVTVTAVSNTSVTIEVVEHFSSRALSSIFDLGARRGIDDGKDAAEKHDWLKIGAMLLFGEKAMSGDVEQPEDTSGPDDFVANVVPIESTSIGEG